MSASSSATSSPIARVGGSRRGSDRSDRSRSSCGSCQYAGSTPISREQAHRVRGDPHGVAQSARRARECHGGDPGLDVDAQRDLVAPDQARPAVEAADRHEVDWVIGHHQRHPFMDQVVPRVAGLEPPSCESPETAHDRRDHGSRRWGAALPWCPLQPAAHPAGWCGGDVGSVAGSGARKCSDRSKERGQPWPPKDCMRPRTSFPPR